MAKTPYKPMAKPHVEQNPIWNKPPYKPMANPHMAPNPGGAQPALPPTPSEVLMGSPPPQDPFGRLCATLAAQPH